MLHQQIPKASQGISVGYLVTGIYSAKLRKCATVYDLRNRTFICQVVEVLQYEQPKHQFQLIGLVAALSFIIDNMK